MGITPEFAASVLSMAERAASAGRHTIDHEWLEEALSDILLWVDKRPDYLPSDPDHRVGAAAKLVVRVACQKQNRFRLDLLVKWHASRRKSPIQIIPFPEHAETESIDVAESPDYSEALALLPEDLRRVLFAVIEQAQGTPRGWVREVDQEYSGRRRATKALVQFRKQLRRQLGLSDGAGWAEIRRALWRSQP